MSEAVSRRPVVLLSLVGTPLRTRVFFSSAPDDETEVVKGRNNPAIEKPEYSSLPLGVKRGRGGARTDGGQHVIRGCHQQTGRKQAETAREIERSTGAKETKVKERKEGKANKARARREKPSVGGRRRGEERRAERLRVTPAGMRRSPAGRFRWDSECLIETGPDRVQMQ